MKFFFSSDRPRVTILYTECNSVTSVFKLPETNRKESQPSKRLTVLGVTRKRHSYYKY